MNVVQLLSSYQYLKFAFIFDLNCLPYLISYPESINQLYENGFVFIKSRKSVIIEYWSANFSILWKEVLDLQL